MYKIVNRAEKVDPECCLHSDVRDGQPSAYVPQVAWGAAVCGT